MSSKSTINSCRLTNNVTIERKGDKILDWSESGHVAINLDGYVIMPLEQYGRPLFAGFKSRLLAICMAFGKVAK